MKAYIFSYVIAVLFIVGCTTPIVEEVPVTETQVPQEIDEQTIEETDDETDVFDESEFVTEEDADIGEVI